MSKSNDPTRASRKHIPTCIEIHYDPACRYEYLEDWIREDNTEVFIAVRICNCTKDKNKEEFLKRDKIRHYETGKDTGVDPHKYVGTNIKVCEWRRVPIPGKGYIKFERICKCKLDDSEDDEPDP
ncbi:hypothetical protein ACJMK2_017398 [Sinanodonta woodiana]|uniref:Uncharacterized protein n=1 Tax=Sinanodonta woodiana TaxID=1069815 RepID=A0ABD3UBK3_SINWO